MSPLKRRREVHDGEEEVVEVDGARSSLRRENPKRARLSNALRSHPQDSSEALDASELSDEGYLLNGEGLHLTHEDASDEELDERMATQYRIQQKQRDDMDNRPADNGIIESVTVTNFMCHLFLEVTLGPLINFIIGQNGSGKSAVLTAITLCLGGKASSTNRGQSLKSFIKEGQETCILSVKLKNKTEAGYQHEVYGDSIIIERSFSRSGSSSFKLKSYTGRLISNRKGDLDDICDFFALQLDNPMNVLTQDMARQFLSNSTPHDKYSFWIKGVQLEQLSQDYQLVEEFVDAIEGGLRTREESIADLRKERDEAVKRQQTIQKHDSLHQKLRRLSWQMAWAQVEEQERNLESFTSQVNTAEQTIQNAEAKAVTTGAKLVEADKGLEIASKVAQEAKNSTQPLKHEKDLLKHEFDGVKSERLSVQQEQRTIRESIKSADSRIEKTKRDIADEYKKLEEANGGAHTRRLAELDEHKVDVEKARERLEEHRAGFAILDQEKRRAEDDVRKIHGPLQSKQEEVKQCDEQLKRLLKDRGQQQNGYPPNMPRLVRAIQEEGRFRERPIGPIGDHVRLLKPVWSQILEKSFGGTLESFIVTSKQDQNVLADLMRKVHCVSQIIIANHYNFDYSHNEPDPNFVTSLRALEIDNDIVRRQLIIGQSIEQTLLIENRRQANLTMFDSGKLRNVKQCFCMNEHKPGWGQRLSYGFQGGEVMGPMPPFSGRPRMKTDIEFQINHCRETLQRLKREQNDLYQRQRELQLKVKDCDQALHRFQRQSSQLKLDMQKAENAVEDLQDALDQESIEEGLLDGLKENLKEAEEEKTTCEGSYQDAVQSLDKYKESMIGLTNRLKAIDAQITQRDAAVVKAEAEMHDLDEKRYKILQAKNRAIEDVAESRDVKRRLEIQREALVTRVAEYTQQASQISSRVPIDDGETTESIERQLTQLDKDLKSAERRLGGTRERIVEAAAKAHAAYETAENQYKTLDELKQASKIQSLKNTTIERQERWRLFRHHIAARARLQFSYLLSERGFRGSVHMSHKERLLDISVEPDETKRSKGRQTQTLSGGEKSFSTTCLLLCFWEAMGAPIRCLDEFDVFMDSVNRAVSMRMMVVAARRSVGRQFIFITPNSMNEVADMDDVKIIRMKNPERGQTTIALST